MEIVIVNQVKRSLRPQIKGEFLVSYLKKSAGLLSITALVSPYESRHHERKRNYTRTKWKFPNCTARWSTRRINRLQDHKDLLLFSYPFCEHLREQHGRAHYQQHQKNAHRVKFSDLEFGHLRFSDAVVKHCVWLCSWRKQLRMDLRRSHVQIFMASTNLFHLRVFPDSGSDIFGPLPNYNAPVQDSTVRKTNLHLDLSGSRFFVDGGDSVRLCSGTYKRVLWRKLAEI